MTITITLTSAGSDSGPFDIYGNSTGAFVLITSGVSKLSLTSGYNISVPDGTTIVRVQSIGTCTNYQDIPVQTTTTTVAPTTAAPTTTAPAFKSVNVNNNSSSGYVTVYGLEVDGIVLIEDTVNFPLTAGQSLTGLISNSSATASVYVSFSTPTDAPVTVINSYGVPYCVQSPGSETIIVDFSGPGSVSVNVGDQGELCL